MIWTIIYIATIPATIFLFAVWADFYYKLTTRGKIYIEFINAGTSEFDLLEIKEGNIIEADHGIYQLPKSGFLTAEYPPSLPTFLRVPIKHLKYHKGEREGLIQIEGATTITMSAARALETERANLAVLKQGSEHLKRESVAGRLSDSWIPYGAIVVILTGVGFFGWKLLMDELAIITKAIGGG